MKAPARLTIAVLCSVSVFCACSAVSHAAAGFSPTMADYCITPPFIAQQIPPQVLFTVGKDHKMYSPAYNDSSDISGISGTTADGEDIPDGVLETGYKHSINYYGYFDSNKCYSYSSGVMVPFGRTSDKFCTTTGCTDAAGTAIDCSGKFSGNFLNWAAMSRADIIKLVIYGGFRTSDNNGVNYAEISGEYIPQDSHIWGKEYLGADADKLFPNGVANKRALFCVNGATAGGKQISQLKIIHDVDLVVANATANNSLRAWHWINVNGNADICSDTKIDTNGDAVADANAIPAGARNNYNVTARVCKADDGFMNDTWEKKHCKLYGTNGRPIGLMQIYGEQGPGTKVCSRDQFTSCTSNSNCTGKGECVDKTLMYFGLMMGSYQNPKAGGYLRKNIWSIMNETNVQGILQTSDPDGKGLVMKSFEELKCPATYPLSSHWGNPIGEILYEGMRYWAGKQNATTDFTSGISNGANGDNGYFSSLMSWEKPGLIFPSCSIPFVLLFSDIYNSYDDDQLPSSAFSSWTNSNAELNDFNVQTYANMVSTNESKANTPAMIGNSGTTVGANTNNSCTSKTISGFGNIRGLCPGEPDQKGTYYPAAVALYGHTQLESKNETGSNPVSNVNSYVVAFNSVIPEIAVGSGTRKATIVPYGRSQGGTCTTANFTFTTDPASPPAGGDVSTTPSRGLIISPNGTTGSCDSLQTTSLYVMGKPNDDPYNPTNADSPRYDVDENLTYIKFRWGTDDIGGTDYDLDVLEEYEICAAANSVGCKDYNGNALALAADQVAVTVKRVFSSAGNRAAVGFIISGTGNTDGAYLPVRKIDNLASPPAGGGAWDDLPYQRTIIFTITGGGGELLKDPLWYAAKYGGFNDMDHNGLPFTDETCDPKTRGASTRSALCNEWDTKGEGNPDNYFLISNPQQTEAKIRDALNAILARTASGTAASILSNSQGSGANILQAVFYPKKSYEENTELSWAGELINLWYYVDPFIGGSTIREDTDYTIADPLPTPNPDHIFKISNDKVIQFFFDASTNQTKARRINSDLSFEEVFPDDPENGVMSLWNSGKLLWKRTPATRNVYSTINGTSLLSFKDTIAANLTAITPYLQATGATAAAKEADAARIMQYVLGTDVCRDGTSPCTSPSRSRKATIRNRGGTLSTHIWKLGDIVSSTPRIQGNQGLAAYNLSPPLGYKDQTYNDFINTATYKNRGLVYVGANDGMLHAFKLGKLNVSPSNDGTQAILSGQFLGEEQWAFIPRHTLPYLKYLMDPTYKDNHVFFVDGSTAIFDVSTASADADYWNTPRTSSGWKSILVGSMGIGGASRINTSTCTDGTSAGTCVKAPIMNPAAPTEALGYSSYYALDVTGQDFDESAATAGAPASTLRQQPTLKWEFNDPALGYSTSGPAIVRINAKTVSGSHYTHDPAKNGRWLAVFASGPTGPIEKATRQFKGKSDQNLKLFVVDLEKGPVAGSKWVIDTGIPEAFAGNIMGGVDDTERANLTEGYYQDDILYIGYTKKSSAGTWTDGGVLRVVIPHDNDPDNLDLSNSITPINAAGFNSARHWIVSKVIEGSGTDNIGPVTTAVAKLQGSSMYLFFGSGRYYYPQDDTSGQRRLYMVKDKCFKAAVTHPDNTKQSRFDIDDVATSTCMTELSLADLTNRTDASNPADDTSVTNGWYINLDSGERVTTDTVSTVNGAVYFTTFIPTGDICSFGGSSFFWGVKYNSGFQLPASAKLGKALIQVSTGSFEEVDIATQLTANFGRKSSSPLVGKPAADAPPIITKAGLSPLKKILHIQERVK